MNKSQVVEAKKKLYIVFPTDQNNLRTISAFYSSRNNSRTVLTNLLVDSLDQRGFWDNSLQLQVAVIIAVVSVVLATVASALISILLQLQLAIVIWFGLGLGLGRAKLGWGRA